MLYDNANDYWANKRKLAEQKSSPEQQRRDAMLVAEADKRLAFLNALIKADALDVFMESGWRLAPIEPVANLGFPIP